MRHPAEYSKVLYPVMAEMLIGSDYILDIFAGRGNIFKLSEWLPEARFEALEIEPEWAAADKRITLGNALYLPWADDTFDAICTSPTYSNRMSDKYFRPKGKWKYITYGHYLGRRLHADNSGEMNWGDKYREFHVLAYTDALRVLKPAGAFVLNMKDHIRNGERQLVTDWHITALEQLGCRLIEHRKIDCPGMRFGQNHASRVEYESVVKFIL